MGGPTESAGQLLAASNYRFCSLSLHVHAADHTHSAQCVVSCKCTARVWSVNSRTDDRSKGCPRSLRTICGDFEAVAGGVLGAEERQCAVYDGRWPLDALWVSVESGERRKMPVDHTRARC